MRLRNIANKRFYRFDFLCQRLQLALGSCNGKDTKPVLSKNLSQ